MKGRILQTLIKSIPQSLILHLDASVSLPALPPPLRDLNPVLHPPTSQKPEVIDITALQQAEDLMRDLDKENIRPAPAPTPTTPSAHRCPPGGEGSVVLYTTTLRGIRKTFEDCVTVRNLLQSSKVVFDERDVSMHNQFREEFRRVLGPRVTTLPRLFIKGRYVGGAEEVLEMHEQGLLMPLLQGMPRSEGAVCEECAGTRFVICFRCNGSRKVYDDEGATEPVQCHDCNERGLILCLNC